MMKSMRLCSKITSKATSKYIYASPLVVEVDFNPSRTMLTIPNSRNYSITSRNQNTLIFGGIGLLAVTAGLQTGLKLYQQYQANKAANPSPTTTESGETTTDTTTTTASSKTETESNADKTTERVSTTNTAEATKEKTSTEKKTSDAKSETASESSAPSFFSSFFATTYYEGGFGKSSPLLV